jgi:putative sterol carrier protein
MATVDECRNVLEKLSGKVAAKSGDFADLSDFERTLVCDITDLDVSFQGTLTNGKLDGVTEGDNPDADVRVSVASDDLIALSQKQLKPAKAFLTGKVKVKANVKDLNKLRKALKVD